MDSDLVSEMGAASIHDVDNHVLQHILSFLPSSSWRTAGLVCREWRGAVQDMSLLLRGATAITGDPRMHRPMSSSSAWNAHGVAWSELCKAPSLLSAGDPGNAQDNGLVRDIVDPDNDLDTVDSVVTYKRHMHWMYPRHVHKLRGSVLDLATPGPPWGSIVIPSVHATDVGVAIDAHGMVNDMFARRDVSGGPGGSITVTREACMGMEWIRQTLVRGTRRHGHSPDPDQLTQPDSEADRDGDKTASVYMCIPGSLVGYTGSHGGAVPKLFCRLDGNLGLWIDYNACVTRTAMSEQHGRHTPGSRYRASLINPLLVNVAHLRADGVVRVTRGYTAGVAGVLHAFGTDPRMAIRAVAAPLERCVFCCNRLIGRNLRRGVGGGCAKRFGVTEQARALVRGLMTHAFDDPAAATPLPRIRRGGAHGW